MRILLLGGGAFVGRAIAEAAISRGHVVTTVTRSALPKSSELDQTESIYSVRTEADAFIFAVDRQWDVVFDTWASAPRVVEESVKALRPHTSYYSYVSSCSVYAEDPPPFGMNEDSPTVAGDPS